MAARNRAVYRLEPAGLMDRGDPRVMRHAGAEVQKYQPFGCPKNGTMRMCYVQVADTGESIGLVSIYSLVKTGKTAPLRDLAAEARDARSAQLRARIRVV
jgi:hypothetical protein